MNKSAVMGIGEQRMISVIIPARNECDSITFLINDLKKQSYSNFEVIIVDDHSEDKTVEVANESCKYDKLFTVLSAEGIGKKQALTIGIALAKGSIVVTTDADCRVGENWIADINKYFDQDHLIMLSGGVRISENGSFFSHLQALEFCSLIGSGAATLAMGFPTMCNGANLAFRKSAFEAVNGYSDNLHIASGDDEFLMRKIFSKYPYGIQFMRTSHSVVSTQSQKNLKGFINQRMRWAGKWKYHQDIKSKVLAVYIFLFQFIVLILLPGVLLGWINLKSVILLLATKCIIEFLFLKPVSGFLKVKWRWTSFIALQFLYPFYAVSIGFFTHFQSVKWKGRALK